ncbi:uncharacterized protein LOC132749778 [Ruditapes philippinarum]|uniref:uncharacterized protein LOC132749778 n=1 Tax=Ruditapes philippinarum TaxID=129788 RepID=UPI00295BF692|nr:uncharacterized protein LOC132749778 [Ruditapes philippinarum]
MGSEELDSDLFTNWVRGSKGLEYLQEGLQEFVGEKVLQCRDNTLQKIILTLPSGSPQQCNQCTSHNLSPDHFNTTKACSRRTCTQKSPTNCFGSRPVGRRKCPGSICSKFYDSIIHEHVFEDPLWKNTDPSTWCSDPGGWSYAKCFQTTKGPGTSAKDTDAAGLLSIIINNKQMQNFVSSINPYNNTRSFHIARDIRNEILHSSKLEIDETTVCSYLDAFIVVLQHVQDPNGLINDKASKEAVLKLTQLRNNTIHISQGDTVTLLENRNKALTELDERTAESLRKLDEKALAVRNTLRLDVDKFKNSVLVDVGNAGTSVKQTLMAQITIAGKQGIQDIAGKTTDGICKINTAGKQAIQDIGGNTTDGISKINTAGDQALQDIAGNTNDCISKINKAGNQAKSDIVGQKIEAISNIRFAKDNALSEITKAGKEAKSDVLRGASAASSDKSEHVVTKTSRFQRGLMNFGNLFNCASPKSHLKESPSRSKQASKLKNELITWYKTYHSTVPLSPLTDAVHLAGFYLMPEIDIHTYQAGGGKKTARVNSLRDLFTSGRSAQKEINLSAVAGFGKTAFSKYLALTWCQVHQKDENYKHFKKEELKALSGFEFLFLVLLRDSAKVCDVDDMIEKQLIHNLPCSSSMPKGLLKDILWNEKCLVILDGLDEWTHPDNDCSRFPKSIPHRYARDKCVILTTTRPWKLGMSNLEQKGETVELVKLNKDNARQFKKNAIKTLKKNLEDRELENEVCGFEKAISGHDLEDMDSTPLLILYLIYLWVEKIPIGNSAVELYTGIIQLLLSRTEILHGNFHSSCKTPPSIVPECFRNHKHFCSYYMFLLTIGKLAFYTLFSKKKEHTLVFDENVAETYLNQEDLKSSYQSGILSESKVKKLIHESSKISFSHKTVQEYFSAMFISFHNTSEVKRILFEECHCLQNILDLSKVFVFISNMNPKLMSAISGDLMPVINNDKITIKYRTLTIYDYMYIKPLEEIQDMYISCAKERKESKDLKLCLQDFICNENCKQENYFKQLQQLCQQNKENIKSIMIINKDICSLQKISKLFTLSDLPHVEKLYYCGKIVGMEIMSLLLNPLKCLTVISCKWEKHQIVVIRCGLSAEINDRLVKLQHLECLSIEHFTMTHKVMETLLNFLTCKKSMKEISLYRLYCSEHETSCRGFNLDLSQHSQLRCLGFGLIPVSQLKMDVSLLEKCEVGKLYKPGVVSSYLSQLPAARKLQTFWCSNLESFSDIKTMVQTLPLLHHIKEVRLDSMNLDKRSLTLSTQMINIEHVYLFYITMSCSVLDDLITVINKLPHTVTVCMKGCDIIPETEFEKFKTVIKQSVNFVVIGDGTFRSGVYVFEFKSTKKQT